MMPEEVADQEDPPPHPSINPAPPNPTTPLSSPPPAPPHLAVEDEGDPAHPGRAVREPDRGQVLGGGVRGARDRPHRPLRRRHRPAARARQRLLQRGLLRPLRAPRGPHGPRAGHHGLRPLRPLRRHLPPRQLRLRPVRRRQQLGQGPLHRGRRAHRLRPRRRPQGGRELRLPPRFPGVPLAGRRHGVRHGHAAHLQDPGGVPGPHDAHLLCLPLAQGLRHRRRALQRHPLRPPARRERRRVHGARQRGALRHLLPHPQAHNPKLWRPEPPHLGHHERGHLLPALPGAAQLGPPQAGREPHPVPAAALLHGGLRAADLARQPTVPRAHGPGADAADVGRQEHDVRGGPSPRALPHGVGHVPGQDEHQGGGRADAERAEQELELLRGVDPQQRQVDGVRHPADGAEDGLHLHRQLDVDPGDVPARERAVHGHVPAQGLPALVHGGGHGRDGVHRGREQHERPGVRVPAVPGRHRRRGGRVRGRRPPGGGLAPAPAKSLIINASLMLI